MKRLIPFVALLFVTACGGDNGPSALPPTTSAPYSETDLVVGLLDHLEVWNPDLLQKYLQSSTKSYEEIAGELLL